MTEHQRYRSVVDVLLADADVSEAQMMGMPSLKLGSKMFGEEARGYVSASS